MGSQPLGFAVSRERGSSDADYELCVRAITLAHDYFEELALPQLPEGVRQTYQDFMKEARPLFARLNRATGKLLLPALDGQAGIVLDVKWKSKQWHQAMPATDRDLPLPEIAVVLGVQDAAKLRQAFQEYRAVYNGLVDVIAKLAPGDFPDIKLPAPKTKKVQAGTLYSYSLPDALGLDPQVAPTGGQRRDSAHSGGTAHLSPGDRCACCGKGRLPTHRQTNRFLLYPKGGWTSTSVATSRDAPVSQRSAAVSH